jgi:hypothetical protein
VILPQCQLFLLGPFKYAFWVSVPQCVWDISDFQYPFKQCLKACVKDDSRSECFELVSQVATRRPWTDCSSCDKIHSPAKVSLDSAHPKSGPSHTSSEGSFAHLSLLATRGNVMHG